ETCRQEDVICRIGGEEFGVILPGGSLEDATALGERLREGIGTVSFPGVGRISVSVGVAEGPLHASSPRELTACADLALLEAKVSGKDQVVVYAATSWSGRFAMGLGLDETTEGVGEGSEVPSVRARLASLAAGSPRSVAQLRVLQSLSARLNRLNDVQRI